MEHKLIVGASPFIRDKNSTKSLMIDVCIALIPVIIASTIIFGLKALLLVAIGATTSVIFEALFQVFSKQKLTIYDGSAVVTGILIALNVPVSAPLWIPAFGSLIAIVLVKQMFGGIGSNFVNPALTARTIMFMSWATMMSVSVVDGVSSATPLANAYTSTYSLGQLFIGNFPGMIGETSKIALLIGIIYLIVKKVVDWRIPVSFVGTVFVMYFIKTGTIYTVDSGVENALGQILSGGLFLGAFFMATDYVTSPIHKTGRIIMGIGCGIITYVIRSFGNYAEGVSFAILFMNVATPLINKFIRPKAFWEVKTRD